MASNLKGITIEINGDTKPLQQALSGVNTELRDTQYQLRQTEKLLKLDPTNTELLTQKQDLLSRAIQDTSEKLKTLNKAKEQFGDYSNLTKDEKDKYNALTREIESCKQQQKKLNDEVENTGESFEDATDNALSFADVLKANVLSNVITSGIQAIGNGIKKVASTLVDVTKSGIQYNATMESYQASFTAMIGSAEQASKALDNIKKSASASPFDLSDLVRANQLLLTTGESAERAEKVINALGDAVAYTGGGNDELTRMSANLQQIKNVGKATATDIRQFAMAGIDVYGILSDYMGVSIEQVKELDISYEDLSNALIMSSEEGGRYFNAMQTQSQTLSGQLNLLESNWKQLTGVIANDATSALKDKFMPAVNNALDSMIRWEEEGFGTLGEAMGSAIADIISVIAENLPDLLQAGYDMAIEVGKGLLKKDAKGKTMLETSVQNLVEKLIELVSSPDFIDTLWNIGVAIGTGIYNGIKNKLNEAINWINTQFEKNVGGSFVISGVASSGYSSHGGGGSHRFSGGYDFGGLASGGITLNASFNVNGQLNESTAKQLASIMANEINEKLGGMV